MGRVLAHSTKQSWLMWKLPKASWFVSDAIKQTLLQILPQFRLKWTITSAVYVWGFLQPNSVQTGLAEKQNQTKTKHGHSSATCFSKLLLFWWTSYLPRALRRVQTNLVTWLSSWNKWEIPPKLFCSESIKSRLLDFFLQKTFCKKLQQSHTHLKPISLKSNY